MLHAMLPTKGPTDNNSAKYVDSGFDLLVSELKKKGVTNVKNLRLGLQVLQICFLV
jgi:chemotaxis receptor (MCP) glutamine deamidase CheD